MKHYIVGAFSTEAWKKHGELWFAYADKNKGSAEILVFKDDILKMFNDLKTQEGCFLYLAPDVRLEAEPVEVFKIAQNKFAVVEGDYRCWAAPYDLIDMLVRVIKISNETGCIPPGLEMTYIGCFVECFPWFAQNFIHEGIVSLAINKEPIDSMT